MSDLRQFFVLEATDYLDQLEELLDPEDPDAFAASDAARLCRALRGAARLSRDERIREIAASMERGSNAVGSGELPWDEGVRDAFVRSIDGVRSLLRGEGSGDGGDGPGAIRAAWDELLPEAEESGRPEEPAAAGELTDFAVSELGSIQEALSEAADAAEAEGGDVRGAAEGVVEALGPLAGAAWLDRFPGLGDFLTEVEEVMDRLAARGPGRGDGWADFAREAAAVAGELTGATETDAGEAPPSITELRRRGRELLEGEGQAEVPAGEHAVPIEELFFDAADGIVSRPREEEELPVEVRNFFRIEASSLVDRAEQLAADVRRGEERAARELVEACAELARIFASFKFSGAAEAARSVASRAREAPDGEAAARIAAAMPDVRALVEEIDDPRNVAERVRRIRDLVEVDEEAPAGPEARPAVPIEDLVYRGEAALARAEALAPEVERCLDAGDVAGLRGHLEEIFDLISVAREGRGRG